MLALITLIIILPAVIVLSFLSSSASRVAYQVEMKSLDETTHLIEQDLLNNVIQETKIFNLNLKNIIIDLESLKVSILGSGLDQSKLSDFYYKNRLISSVYFINPSGGIFFSPSSDVLSQGKIIDLSKMEDFNFFKAGKREYIGRWVGPYNDFKTRNKVITYISPIWRGNEFVGIVGFDLTIDSLFTDFINFDPSQSSYVFIAKNTGEIISTSDKLYEDLKIKKTENSSIFDSQAINDLKIPDFFKKDEGMSLILGDKIIAFSNIPSFTGKLILISPLGEIINAQKEKALEISSALTNISLKRNLWMAALGVFIVLSAFYLIQKGLIKPIIIFRNAAKNIKKGKLDTRVSINSTDEIGELALDFNQMTAQIQQSYLVLEEEKTKLKASIGSLPVGFIMTDNQNKILTINQSAIDIIFSLSKNVPKVAKDYTLDSIGAKFKNVIDLKSLVKKCLLEKKIVLVREVMFENRYVKLLLSPIIEDSSALGVVILIEDITEAKLIQRSRDEFFSIASHELRTPLTAIRGNTALIKEYYWDKLKDKDLEEMIEDIHKSSTRLIGIVNDFLDTSRLELGKMEFKKEEIDAEDLVNEVLKEYITTGSMKKLYLEAEKPETKIPLMIADRDRIKQILINLIGNAIKFTEEGGVKVKIKVENNFVKILVADTGKGISPESQNLLFRKFQQAAESIFTRDAIHGTGLGLYISRMMAEGMGGEVKLESSAVGKGSVFSLSLPIKK